MPAVKSTYRRAVHLHRSRRRLHALAPLHIFKKIRKEVLTPYDAVLSFFLEYISCIIMAIGNARHGVLQL